MKCDVKSNRAIKYQKLLKVINNYKNNQLIHNANAITNNRLNNEVYFK